MTWLDERDSHVCPGQGSPLWNFSPAWSRCSGSSQLASLFLYLCHPCRHAPLGICGHIASIGACARASSGQLPFCHVTLAIICVHDAAAGLAFNGTRIFRLEKRKRWAALQAPPRFAPVRMAPGALLGCAMRHGCTINASRQGPTSSHGGNLLHFYVCGFHGV